MGTTGHKIIVLYIETLKENISALPIYDLPLVVYLLSINTCSLFLYISSKIAWGEIPTRLPIKVSRYLF